jgi:hypothetical protein
LRKFTGAKETKNQRAMPVIFIGLMSKASATRRLQRGVRPQQQQDIPRELEMAKKSGREFLPSPGA